MASVAPAQAEAPLVLALDVGSSSVRALLFDALGRAVEGSAAALAHTIEQDAYGRAECDPDALLERLFACIDGALDRAGSLAGQIAAVASCSLVSNVLGVDGRGAAITPLYSYADTRASEAARALRSELDEAAIHERTGCRFHSSYLPARFRWLAETAPDLMARVRRWLSLGEYLTLKLFGEPALSYSVASWTGLLDRHALRWDATLLAALPLDGGTLSPLRDVDEPQAGLRDSYARRWPALRAVPWFPTAGDGATANVGSGCVTAGRVALTIGTTSALRVALPGPVTALPAGLWCYRVTRELSLPGGALSEGGNVVEWARTTLRLPDAERCARHLRAAPPDGHGLTLLPLFAGERSPGWAGEARATIHGLTLATTPLDIFQAALEGVAYRIATLFELLRPRLPADPLLVASGGAARRAPVWLQIICDAVGQPLVESASPEASARGAALLALRTLGRYARLDEAPDLLGRRYEPSGERHALYREAMARQQWLYGQVVAP